MRAGGQALEQKAIICIPFRAILQFHLRKPKENSTLGAQLGSEEKDPRERHGQGVAQNAPNACA